ncbi:hypothetical protein [Campylobacter magnus]|uniref:hypothetical protein n=1 Tax=Campylobacter magnus TaxID=3026462 RepID=UPI0026DECBE9|nr:hypothetical protein [Campylobacter magnus]MDO2408336.1 hypothetical protein [Campylobacter magnus]
MKKINKFDLTKQDEFEKALNFALLAKLSPLIPFARVISGGPFGYLIGTMRSNFLETWQSKETQLSLIKMLINKGEKEKLKTLEITTFKMDKNYILKENVGDKIVEVFADENNNLILKIEYQK